MTRLRHAGSPVGTPEKLSRGQQTAILLQVSIAHRILSRRMRLPVGQTHQEEMDSFRACLRLDDPVLDDLIAQKKRSGQPWGPWRTTTYKERGA